MPLQTASFKGVPFQVAKHGFSINRRIAQYDRAHATLPINEDLGRQARNYQIQAWVLGANYSVQRDRLLQACTTPGPGVLIHPYLGLLRVHCERAEIIENSQENRIARLNLNFIEAGSVVATSTYAIPIASAVDRAIATSQQSFLSSNIVNTPQILQAGVLNLSQSLQSIAGGLSYPGVATAGIMDAFKQMNVQAANLAATPTELATTVLLSIRTFGQAGAPHNAIFKAYQQIMHLDTTTDEVPELVQLAQDSALVESVRLVAENNEEPSINEELLKLDTLLEQRTLQTNSHPAYTTWHQLQMALIDLKGQRNEHIIQADKTQPWLVFAAQHGTQLDATWESYRAGLFDYPAWVHSGEKIKLQGLNNA